MSARAARLEADRLIVVRDFEAALAVLVAAYDGFDGEHARMIGMIHAYRGDWAKARPFLETAARAGLTGAQYWLGRHLCATGEERAGMALLESASQGGEADASLELHRLYRRRRDGTRAMVYLRRAAENQRDPWAITILSRNRALGRLGIREVPRGFAEGIRNVPVLLRYLRAHPDSYDVKAWAWDLRWSLLRDAVVVVAVIGWLAFFLMRFFR
jgi:hypothetical protein